jgi:hypothetical protein
MNYYYIIVLLIVIINSSFCSNIKKERTKINLNSNNIKLNEWNTIAKHEQSLDLKTILSDYHLKSKDQDPFPHTRHLLQSIKDNKKVFEVVEKVNSLNDIEAKTFDERTKLSLYNTTTIYNLKEQNYYSLDEGIHYDNIKDITEHTIEYCSVINDIKAGDFFLGSHLGDWVKKNKHWTSNLPKTTGLFFTRQVDSIKSSENKDCVIINTKVIHPFELLESFNVVSVSQLGNGVDYKTQEQVDEILKKQEIDRHLGSFYEPDAPVVACTKSNIGSMTNDDKPFNDDLTSYYGSFTTNGVDYSLFSTYTNGCVGMQGPVPGVPSFNFNYNGAGGATKSFPLVSGVTCSNCYAYIGASFMIELNYHNSGYKISAEAKLMGGLGFNVQLSLEQDASLYSTNIPLLGKSSQSTDIPLGVGLVLNTNFGGLNMELDGSGSISGSADMGAGASANAYIGIEYVYNDGEDDWSFPSGAELSYTSPYFTTSVESVSLSATAELIATQDFQLAYEWLDISWISGDFSVSFSGTATYADSFATSSILSLSLYTPSLLSSTSSTPSVSSSNENTYKPGDEITFNVDYSNFRPSEETVLYFSIHDAAVEDDGYEGLTIFHTSIISSTDGSGNVKVKWTIPWDMRFLKQSSTKFSIRGSNIMSNRVYSDIINFDINNIGLINTPISNEIIDISNEYNVKWNSELLKFFKLVKGSKKRGSLKTVQFIDIEVIAEKLSSDGNSVISTSKYILNDDQIHNSGSTHIKFHQDIMSSGQRFYMNVKSSHLNALKGWSTGYFYLIDTSSITTPTSLRQASLLPYLSSSIQQDIKQNRKLINVYSRTKDELFYKTLSNTNSINRISKESEPITRDLTASCPSDCSPNDGTITFGASVDGAFTSLAICYITVPVGLNTGAFSLLSECECVDFGSNPAPAPAPGPSPTPSTDDNGPVPTPTSTDDGPPVPAPIYDDSNGGYGDDFYSMSVISTPNAGDDDVSNTHTSKDDSNQDPVESSSSSYTSNSAVFIVSTIVCITIVLSVMVYISYKKINDKIIITDNNNEKYIINPIINDQANIINE